MVAHLRVFGPDGGDCVLLDRARRTFEPPFAVIRTDSITKRYGSALALDAVDLHVPQGAVYGLVGPNGAGKTTMLGILAGLRQPTSGSVSIAADGANVAVLPDTPRFDAWLTAAETVDLARTIGPKSSGPERVRQVLTEVGLGDATDRRVGGFSRGMLQRLGIAATIINQPQLLLLDEPSSALDPSGRREVLDLVAQLRGEATVVFSSHILSDVQEVCDTVGILRQGRLVYQGGVQDLIDERTTPSYLIRLRSGSAAVVEAFEVAEWVRDVSILGKGQLSVEVESTALAERFLVKVLASVDAEVISIAPQAATLEDVVLEIVA